MEPFLHQQGLLISYFSNSVEPFLHCQGVVISTFIYVLIRKYIKVWVGDLQSVVFCLIFIKDKFPSLNSLL